MYLIIVGCGKVGFYLCKDMLSRGHEVTVVDKRPEKVTEARERVGNVIFEGDGCDPAMLEKLGVRRAEVLVAATGDDEDNLVVCHVGRHLNPGIRTVGRVNNPKNESTFRKLGLNAVVNSSELLAHMIEHEFSTGDLVPLISLRRCGLDLVEVTVAKGSPAAGKLIQDVKLPDRCTLVSILRSGSVVTPRGDVSLIPGDEIIAVIGPEEEKDLQQLLVRDNRGSEIRGPVSMENERGRKFGKVFKK